MGSEKQSYEGNTIHSRNAILNRVNFNEANLKDVNFENTRIRFTNLEGRIEYKTFLL